MARRWSCERDRQPIRARSSEARRSRQQYAQAWHKRPFHLSMTILSKAGSLNRPAQEIVLSQATKVLAEKLMISINMDAGMERVLDCWKVDQKVCRKKNRFEHPTCGHTRDRRRFPASAPYRSGRRWCGVTISLVSEASGKEEPLV